MGKKIRFWIGVAVGAALQYFYDPKAGGPRRARLRDRLTARALDAKDRLFGKETGVGNVDHLRMWRTEARRNASRNL